MPPAEHTSPMAPDGTQLPCYAVRAHNERAGKPQEHAAANSAQRVPGPAHAHGVPSEVSADSEQGAEARGGRANPQTARCRSPICFALGSLCLQTVPVLWQCDNASHLQPIPVFGARTGASCCVARKVRARAHTNSRAVSKSMVLVNSRPRAAASSLTRDYSHSKLRAVRGRICPFCAALSQQAHACC